jgi:hypothetical protein
MMNYCALSTWESVELELRHGDSSAGEDELCSAHQLLPLEDVEGAQILKENLCNKYWKHGD